MARAMVVNAAQLASYSQAKQFILKTGKKTEHSPFGTQGVTTRTYQIADVTP